MKTLQQINERHYKLKEHPFYGNQHTFVSRRRKKKTSIVSTIKAMFVIIIFITCLIYKAILVIESHQEPVKIISPIPNPIIKQAYAQKLEAKVTPKIVLITPTSTPIPLPVKTSNNDEHLSIEKYIRTIFGKDADIAIAVSHHECSPKNPQYPACINHSDIEYSIGLFQINLKNKTQMVQFYRVPGNTLDEKIEWLKNPQNNTLFAYWVFQTSNWYPWTSYTSGRYLEDMPKR